MKESTFNPKLQAIVSIRNLVCGFATDYQEIRSLGKEIDQVLDEISALYINNSKSFSHDYWLYKQGIIQKNVHSLKEILNKTIDKINKKNSVLTKVWDENKVYAENVKSAFTEMYALGKANLPKELYVRWEAYWQELNSKFDAIQNLAVGSSIHLKIIEELAPEEVDELTKDILKSMPINYSIEAAIQYEQEYMEAYEELKNQSSKKKNLWDKFLNILAGGATQSPAEMVMMKRWVEGEKGSL